MRQGDKFNMSALVVVFGLLSSCGVHARQTLTDGEGYRWDILEDGRISDGVNDTFDGGFRLQINGNSFPANRSNVKHTGKGNRKLSLGPNPCGGLQVTRKLLVSSTSACLRYLEILENTKSIPVTVSVVIYTDLGGGNPQNKLLPAPDKAGGVPFVVIGQNPNRSSVAMCFGGKKPRISPVVKVSGGNVYVTFSNVTIKPGKKVALLYVVAQRKTFQQASAFAEKFKIQPYFKTLDRKDRKLVLNVRPMGLWSLDGLELFRGEKFDAMKLRSGEALKGMLQNKSFTLTHEFGIRKVACGKVLTLFSRNQNRYRLVLENGEVLTGSLAETALTFNLRGGNSLVIPLSQIDRYGRRVVPVEAEAPAEGKAGAIKNKGAGENKQDEAAGEEGGFRFSGPIFVLRGGDRLVGRTKSATLNVQTLYGKIPMSVDALKNIQFVTADRSMPVFTCKDGCKFLGMLDAADLDIELMDGSRIALSPHRFKSIYFSPVEDDEEAPVDAKGAAMPTESWKTVLEMVNGDRFMGTLEADKGRLNFMTPFGPQQVGAQQVLKISFQNKGWGQVRVMLWDESTLPGKLPGKTLVFKMASGSILNAPLGAIKSYSSTFALPSDGQIKLIEGLVAQLGSDDAELRKEVHAQLIKMGKSIRAVLFRYWNHNDLEVRTRVRQIFKATAGKNSQVKANASGEVNTRILRIRRWR